MNHWNVKIKIRIEDIETGKVRNKSETFLVHSETIEGAKELVDRQFKDTTIDYEIRAITKSPIADYLA